MVGFAAFPAGLFACLPGGRPPGTPFPLPSPTRRPGASPLSPFRAPPLAPFGGQPLFRVGVSLFPFGAYSLPSGLGRLVVIDRRALRIESGGRILISPRACRTGNQWTALLRWAVPQRRRVPNRPAAAGRAERPGHRGQSGPPRRSQGDRRRRFGAERADHGAGGPSRRRRHRKPVRRRRGALRHRTGHEGITESPIVALRELRKPSSPPSTVRRRDVGLLIALASDLVVAASPRSSSWRSRTSGSTPDGGASLLVPGAGRARQGLRPRASRRKAAREGGRRLGARGPRGPRRGTAEGDRGTRRPARARADAGVRGDEGGDQPLHLAGLRDALDTEATLQGRLVRTEDFREGTWCSASAGRPGSQGDDGTGTDWIRSCSFP